MPFGSAQHDFERDYQRLVGPRLERLIKAFAHLIDREVLCYADACDDIVCEALRLGAAGLTEPAWDELLDWIGLELSHAAFALEEGVAWPR